MTSLLQDVLYALRGLRKSPAFTVTAILTLGLGVGANTAIFSVTNSVLLRPHHFAELDRLVVLREVVRGRSGQQNRLTPADVADLVRVPNLFQGVAAYQFRELNLARNGEADNATAFLVTPNLFDVVGVAPDRGRRFSADDAQPGRDNVVLLSHNFWQRRFGGDPAIVGSTITVDGHDATVLGIMPRDFNYPAGAEVWKPLALRPESAADRANEAVWAVARLAPGASLDKARAVLDAFAATLQREYPNTNTGRSFSLLRLREEQYSDTAPLLLLLQAGASFLLLLACANLGVLVLIRLIGRQRELAIRTALGASRRRLLQLFLAEALLFSLAAGAAAVAISLWSVGMIRNSLSASYTRWVAGWDNMRVDGNVLASAAAVVIAVALLLGFAAVLHAARIDPHPTLKSGGRVGTSRRHHALRNGLVVVQVMLALILLVGAGLIVACFQRLQNVFAALDPAHVLRFSISLPESRYTPAQVSQFHDRLQAQMAGISGVSAVGVITNNPGSNVPNLQSPLTISGQETQRAAETPIAERQTVNPDAFAVLHIPLIEGRLLSPGDGADSARVAVVSHAFAQRYWPRSTAVGQRFRFANADTSVPWITIVGVVGDIQLNWFEPVAGPVIYLPYTQAAARRVTMLVRTSGDPAGYRAPVRQALAQVDPALTTGELNPYSVEIDDSLAPLRMIGFLMLAFGAVALALSAIGIYGVVGHAVAQSTHEFGVRMALGAARRDLLALVAGRALRTTAVGLAFGSVSALILARLARSYMFGVIELRPAIFFGFALLLAVISGIAAIVPARRASRVDPIVALRQE